MKHYTEPCPCKGCTVRTIDCHGKGNCNRTDFTYEQWVASGIEKPKANNWKTPHAQKRIRFYRSKGEN